MRDVRTILCPVDFTPISERNLRLAVEMCKRIGSRLVLQHNLDVRPPSYMSVAWMWSEDHEAAAEAKAQAVPEELDKLFAGIPEGVEYEARVTRGPLEETVLFVARGLPADLLIMGTHGKSSARHDSLTEQIVIQAPCSVLTIGEGYDPAAVFDAAPHREPKSMRFLVPVDFSPRSRGVLDFAFGLAAAMPHRLELLHVVRAGQGADQERREIAAARERLEELVPGSIRDEVEILVWAGDPDAEIPRAAAEMEALCVVMGAHAKGLLRRLLFGTTTMSVLHASPCPVWFVPESLTRAAR